MVLMTQIVRVIVIELNIVFKLSMAQAMTIQVVPINNRIDNNNHGSNSNSRLVGVLTLLLGLLLSLSPVQLVRLWISVSIWP